MRGVNCVGKSKEARSTRKGEGVGSKRNRSNETNNVFKLIKKEMVWPEKIDETRVERRESGTRGLSVGSVCESVPVVECDTPDTCTRKHAFSHLFVSQSIEPHERTRFCCDGSSTNLETTLERASRCSKGQRRFLKWPGLRGQRMSWVMGVIRESRNGCILTVVVW